VDHLSTVGAPAAQYAAFRTCGVDETTSALRFQYRCRDSTLQAQVGICATYLAKNSRPSGDA
jgi:hypothetical protein